MSYDWLPDFVAALIKVSVVVGALMGTVSLMTWVERRGSGIIQLRRGPNRVGPFGLFQPIADGIKFFFKEDVLPPFVHKPTFVAAPGIALCCALIAFAVIPFGGTLTITPESWIGGLVGITETLTVPLVIADIDAGVLLLLAAAGMGVYGIMFAGWASNNKYSQFGGLRAAAQVVSYELALGLGIISVLVLCGTLRPVEIVEAQTGTYYAWNVCKAPIGFFVLLVAGFAETNRLPFDMPEAESELVGGYHTEYSSMKFALFFMAEYIAMITAASLLVTLYLGGYAVPAFIAGPLGLEGNLLTLAQVAVFGAKVAVLLWLFVWVRWSLPRLRYDQVMALGWKALIPLGFLSVILSALLVIFTPGFVS